jgi:hypothetical protein
MLKSPTTMASMNYFLNIFEPILFGRNTYGYRNRAKFSGCQIDTAILIGACVGCVGFTKYILVTQS